MEVEVIGRVRHKNLVRLLGYCVEGAYRYNRFILELEFQFVINCGASDFWFCFLGCLCMSTLTMEIWINGFMGMLVKSAL